MHGCLRVCYRQKGKIGNEISLKMRYTKGGIFWKKSTGRPVPWTRTCAGLLSALHETESWKRYAALRESVMADEGTAALLRRFAAAQSALQMAALSGSEPREEDTRAFEQLSALLYESEEASEYLLAQMKVQQLVAQLMEKITREAGLDIPLG